MQGPAPARRATPLRLPAPGRGLTLVELAVVLAVMTLMMKMAAPVFANWTRNAQVRATSEALQGVLRQAQADAASRSRQVVVFRTSDTTCGSATTASASGSILAIRTVALVGGEAVDTLRCTHLVDSAVGIALSGPTALCFSSAGRLVGNATPGVTGATCAAPTLGVNAEYGVSATGADRPLRVTVSPGGMVRACDPARSLSAGQPDGCT